MKKGILLIQLGTPDTSTVSSVRQYLRLFLSDRRVIDLPTPLRYALLYGIILPFRSRQTTKAYQAIWTNKGSPLRTLSVSLKEKLQEALKTTYVVALGMRYGEPSLMQALKELNSCDEITVLPLYPQYASSTNGSSIEIILKYLSKQEVMPSLRVVRDFYAHPAFIQAQAARIKPYLMDNTAHCLLSYHGLPVRHLEKTACPKVCTTAHPCPPPQNENTACYRAQCFETSRKLAEELGLKKTQYTTAFQSRLGRTPWIKPYSDEILTELAHQGVKKLVVACPSFVTDCLETLEEIGMRAKETWMSLGGETFTLVPCLNDEEAWVRALKKILVNNPA